MLTMLHSFEIPGGTTGAEKHTFLYFPNFFMKINFYKNFMILK